MADDKSIRCDCGYRLRARTEERQVAEVRRHAWEAHGISFSTEEALAVLLRVELEVDEAAPAYLATVSDTASRKEKK
jgi:predicted small metal-binding protein